MSLDPLIGEWEAEFTVFGETARGRVSFAWELGGAFVLQRSSAEHPDAPDGLIVIAAKEEGGYRQHYFDSRGVVRIYEMSLEDGVWTLERDGVQRFHGRFEDDDTIRGAWEWFRDGGWQKDFDVVYRRV